MQCTFIIIIIITIVIIITRSPEQRKQEIQHEYAT